MLCTLCLTQNKWLDARSSIPLCALGMLPSCAIQPICSLMHYSWLIGADLHITECAVCKHCVVARSVPGLYIKKHSTFPHDVTGCGWAVLPSICPMLHPHRYTTAIAKHGFEPAVNATVPCRGKFKLGFVSYLCWTMGWQALSF